MAVKEHGVKRAARARSGETLVETIVSFLVVLLVLTTVTAIVQLASRLNARAAEKAGQLETACTQIENGAVSDTPANGVLTVTMTPPDGISAPYAFDISISIYRTGMLDHFTAAPTGGG